VYQLINATYSGIYDEPVTLTEGLYEGEPYVEHDAACCKSHKADVSYALQDGLLAELPGESQVPEKISAADPVQPFDVDQPENYTLDSQPDGVLQIKADCNQVGAGYSASESGTLSIQPGPATMAACPPESRADEFVQNLGIATGYFFQDGNLYIDMMADGGTLELSPQ
jgi:heat shock protein HslJ